MNVKKIRELLNQEDNDSVAEIKLMNLFSKDETIIPDLMEILNIERRSKKELLSSMNVLLSKADVGLDDKKFNKGNFIQKEVEQFYQKNKDVGHCFRNYEVRQLETPQP